MTERKYNGWTNYETWRINLELFEDAEYMTAAECREYATELISNETGEESLALSYALLFIEPVNWFEISEGLRDY